MTRKASFAIIALAALIFALPSLASAVTITFLTSGEFQNPSLEPSPPTSPVYGVGTDTFEWGVPVSGSDRSSLHFSGSSFDEDVALGTSEYFALGWLDFHNGRIGVDTGANGVQLQIGLDFSAPDVPDEILTVDLAIDNTLNPAGDSVTLSGPAASSPWASTSFSDGGYLYTIEVIGFLPSSDHVSGWCCDGNATWTSLTVDEDCSISAKLKGRVTVVEQPVPEPGTMLLLGSGLLGLVWRRRRG